MFSTLSSKLKRHAALAALLLGFSGAFASFAHAQVTVYTDEGTFNAATATVQFVEDKFEGLVPKDQNTALARTSFDNENGLITYTAGDSLQGYSSYSVGVASATAYGGQFTLDGSDCLYNSFDMQTGIPTVRMTFNRPTTAFGLNFGMTDLYPPDDPRSNYPKTDYIDIQLYAMTDDGDFYPLGEVYHAGYPTKSFIGFVSTVPIAWAEFTHQHPQDYHDPYGYVIADDTEMVFDNVRAGQVPTLPTVTVVGSSPDANAAAGKAGDFVVTLSAPAATDLKVLYRVKGTAKPGVDYAALTGTVKLKAGQTSKKIKVRPLGDLGGATQKVLKLTLQPGTGYLVGTPDPVKLKILNPHVAPPL